MIPLLSPAQLNGPHPPTASALHTNGLARQRTPTNSSTTINAAEHGAQPTPPAQCRLFPMTAPGDTRSPPSPAAGTLPAAKRRRLDADARSTATNAMASSLFHAHPIVSSTSPTSNAEAAQDAYDASQRAWARVLPPVSGHEGQQHGARSDASASGEVKRASLAHEPPRFSYSGNVYRTLPWTREPAPYNQPAQQQLPPVSRMSYQPAQRPTTPSLQTSSAQPVQTSTPTHMQSPDTVGGASPFDPMYRYRPADTTRQQTSTTPTYAQSPLLGSASPQQQAAMNVSSSRYILPEPTRSRIPPRPEQNVGLPPPQLPSRQSMLSPVSDIIEIDRHRFSHSSSPMSRPGSQQYHHPSPQTTSQHQQQQQPQQQQQHVSAAPSPFQHNYSSAARTSNSSYPDMKQEQKQPKPSTPAAQTSTTPVTYGRLMNTVYRPPYYGSTSTYASPHPSSTALPPMAPRYPAPQPRYPAPAGPPPSNVVTPTNAQPTAPFNNLSSAQVTKSPNPVINRLVLSAESLQQRRAAGNTLSLSFLTGSERRSATPEAAANSPAQQQHSMAGPRVNASGNIPPSAASLAERYRPRTTPGSSPGSITTGAITPGDTPTLGSTPTPPLEVDDSCAKCGISASVLVECATAKEELREKKKRWEVYFAGDEAEKGALREQIEELKTLNARLFKENEENRNKLLAIEETHRGAGKEERDDVGVMAELKKQLEETRAELDKIRRETAAASAATREDIASTSAVVPSSGTSAGSARDSAAVAAAMAAAEASVTSPPATMTSASSVCSATDERDEDDMDVDVATHAKGGKKMLDDHDAVAEEEQNVKAEREVEASLFQPIIDPVRFRRSVVFTSRSPFPVIDSAEPTSPPLSRGQSTTSTASSTSTTTTATTRRTAAAQNGQLALALSRRAGRPSRKLRPRLLFDGANLRSVFVQRVSGSSSTLANEAAAAPVAASALSALSAAATVADVAASAASGDEGDSQNPFGLAPRSAVPVLKDYTLGFREGVLDPRTHRLKRGMPVYKVGRKVPGELV
ncbi:uncharacterized protein V1518DRAFT_329102 [Limtongia smithiae]|uniref:uncharacterized protein n=1 Tax=Limtongia smithiae TaxID=1125753 RepID=UPI0034CE90F2